VLFAHCASLSLNAVIEPWNKRTRALAHADQIAHSIGFAMVEAGWRPTVDNYLGRVTKVRILQAVREAKGEQSAQLIDHLKKPDMAREAARLLDGSGWLPDPFRLDTNEALSDEPAETVDLESVDSEIGDDVTDLPAFLTEDGDVGDGTADAQDGVQETHLAATE
jgi:ParB family chromosome partitioning protein